MAAGNGTFQTDINGIELTLNVLRQSLDEARAEYAALSEEIDTIDASWSSGVKPAFMDRLRGDLNELKSVIDEMQGYISDVGFARDEYARSEQEVSDMVNSLLI